MDLNSESENLQGLRTKKNSVIPNGANGCYHQEVTLYNICSLGTLRTQPCPAGAAFLPRLALHPHKPYLTEHKSRALGEIRPFIYQKFSIIQASPTLMFFTNILVKSKNPHKNSNPHIYRVSNPFLCYIWSREGDHHRIPGT